MSDILNYKKPGSTAALSYLSPSFGFAFVRRWREAFLWLVVHGAVILLCAALWWKTGPAAAVTLECLFRVVVIPSAVRRAYARAVEYNSVNGTSSGEILDDPSTASMMSWTYPGLGHLYIGDIEGGIRHLRITAVVIWLPVFLVGLKLYVLGMGLGALLYVAYWLIGVLFVARSAYRKSQEINSTLATTRGGIESKALT